MSSWNDPLLRTLFSEGVPLIDVRAPIEFQEGSIPNSTNLFIMNDEERKLVGTCYKEKGQEAAIMLGHELVSGTVKEERLQRWSEFILKNPGSQVFCFRGGLRSQISCRWLSERGLKKDPIPGGYKRLRQFFISWLEEAPISPLMRIGGLTGSGKTKILEQIPFHLDLEKHAHHRGSAFGVRGPQPSQITFENKVALDLMLLFGKKIILEDESATIGKVFVPRRLYQALRASPLVILETSIEERVQNIFHDYVKGSNPDFFIQGLSRIQKRLGSKKIGDLAGKIRHSFKAPFEINAHSEWIRTLLEEYYDPLYQKDLRQNHEKIVFRGNEKEILAYFGVS